MNHSNPRRALNPGSGLSNQHQHIGLNHHSRTEGALVIVRTMKSARRKPLQSQRARKKADRIELNPMAFFRRTRFSGSRSQWLTRFSGESSVSLCSTAFSRQCRAPGSHSEPSSLSTETKSNHRAKTSETVFQTKQLFASSLLANGACVSNICCDANFAAPQSRWFCRNYNKNSM